MHRNLANLFPIAALAMILACGGDTKPGSAAGTSGARDGGVTATSGAGADANPGSASGSGAGSTKAAGAGGASGASGARAGASGAAGGGGIAAVSGGAGAGGDARDAAVSDDAGAKPDAGPNASCGHCTAYATPMKVGTVAPSELNALSGLAVSRVQPDIIFTHNDHDRAVVYALDLQGKLHARITLENAMASDIEDIAVGPCGAQTCVFLGDIGDNAATRSEYGILRFAQPMVPADAGSTAMTATFERFRFTYEDGSHNAESLMVGPDGSLYIVTKLAPGSGGNVAATGVSSVYKLPASLSTSTVAQATKLATLTVPASGDKAASAAAAHPCGQGFLLRTYNRVYEFLTPQGASFEASFSATPTSIAMPDEPQSEGIDYRADGKGFVTSGEGMNAPIVSTGCQ